MGLLCFMDNFFITACIYIWAVYISISLLSYTALYIAFFVIVSRDLIALAIMVWSQCDATYNVPYFILTGQ